MAITAPLTDQDFETIKAQLETLDGLDEQLRLAEQAGIDVADNKKAARDARSQLNRLKQTYFPNRV